MASCWGKLTLQEAGPRRRAVLFAINAGHLFLVASFGHVAWCRHFIRKLTAIYSHARLHGLFPVHARPFKILISCGHPAAKCDGANNPETRGLQCAGGFIARVIPCRGLARLWV